MAGLTSLTLVFQPIRRGFYKQPNNPILPIDTSNYKGDALCVPAIKFVYRMCKPFEWNKMSGLLDIGNHVEGAKNPIKWILIQNIEFSI
jgi:hypothetical protein